VNVVRIRPGTAFRALELLERHPYLCRLISLRGPCGCSRSEREDAEQVRFVEVDSSAGAVGVVPSLKGVEVVVGCMGGSMDRGTVGQDPVEDSLNLTDFAISVRPLSLSLCF
jgi:hypothetical protein